MSISKRMGAVLCVAVLTSCSDAPITGEPPAVASVSVVPEEGAVVRGGTLTLRAAPRDGLGRPLGGRVVGWTSSEPGTVRPRDPMSGVVVGVQVGGPATIRANVEGRIGTAEVSVLTTGSVVLDEVLARTDEFVGMMLGHAHASMHLNPRFEHAYELKIAMLQQPSLSSDIVRGRYFERVIASGGRDVPVAVVFPADSMRPRTEVAVHEIGRVLPLLEEFMGEPLPAPWVQIWYGFGLGSRGGGGMLNMEDRGTYEAQRSEQSLPYDAILAHELAHSYIGHELLTQFLELYLHNVSRTGSTDVSAWFHTRGYVPGRPENAGLHAIIDIYRIIGHERMSEVYHALHALWPPYGQPLSTAARQAIIDGAPAARQAEVAQKVQMID
jgi:hypothetical protein